MAFILKSSDFSDNNNIPSPFTCDGENISPALNWYDEPAGTRSFVLIMDDPDAPAGVWDHWVLFNIPATTHELPANLTLPPQGAQLGKNSWGKMNYGGPCPPDGEHRYFFKLYALDTILTLTQPNKSQLEAATNGHILGTATLMGKYKKKRR
jgi:Raf kinase inhibitor-like YbhB/YbcL family protein